MYGGEIIGEDYSDLDLMFNENLANDKEELDETEEEIIVHIIGEVKKTGIVKLKYGSRIADVIEAAGGSTDDANLDQINLAYIVEDGQKIYIPNKNDLNDMDENGQNDKTNEYISENSGNNNYVKNSNNGADNKLININTASQSELEILNGIGSNTAQNIINYRNENGKFESIEDIKNVTGIGDAKFENIKDKISIK